MMTGKEEERLRVKIVSLNWHEPWEICVFSVARRSQCHLGESVPHGPICNGGLSLPKDPAASIHRAHGGPGLPAATGPWGRDLHEGE